MGQVFGGYCPPPITGTGTRTDITNSTSARKLLNTHGLTLPVAGKALKGIALALFELSGSAINLGATNVEIMRAMAIIIHEAEKDLDMEKIIDKIDALIKGPIALLDEKVDALAEIATTHKSTLSEVVTEVCTQLHNSSEDIGKIVESAKHASNPAPLRSDGPLSYAAITKAGIPAPLTKILARSDAQDRQILIDRRSVLIANSLKDLTEAQLVVKAATNRFLVTHQVALRSRTPNTT
ncbi:hypothetical protein CY34DRAFT_17660 [Suillus luteus UH-Slu-Lm8-n1]|uniref:Unplaced genomic scaffold CY34scaffold_611, whole genome shotgun sequence n=1 Tax=Suillus luteus UH-Slu-Lm8-n1 TaxID=930992 RepID=A0A0C9ZAK1_9AGAM|nr:hypothetical protein CY34DRAFT_17660 [Suillus luteus UH-Slu-Lm8-n1]